MAEDVRAQIKRVIVERAFLEVSPQDIGDDENLMDEYNIESVNLFEIIIGLEDEFGLTFEEEDFNVETFSNVSNIAGFITTKRGQ